MHTYDNIIKKLIVREDIVRIKENIFEEDPIAINKVVLQKAQAEIKNIFFSLRKFMATKSR